eukprot:g11667.t1
MSLAVVGTTKAGCSTLCCLSAVLHLDRNPYYGGECASLNITNLWQKFVPGSEPPKELGQNREWNVDLIPKFIMASGDLVKILLKTRVSRYLEWKSCEGTYVYQFQEAGLFSGAKYIHKVPASAADGLKSPLMGMLEKPRFINFAQFIMGWEDVYRKFGLQESTIDFIGHAVALWPNDNYLNGPCGPTIQKCRLYLQSVLQYGGSPFIYPIYGLGFSRLAAIHRGTYMLNKSVDGFVYDEQGRVCGVRSGDEVAKCKMVICDPSYAEPTRKTTCFVHHRGQACPVMPNHLASKAVKAKERCLCHDGFDKYVAIVSTVVETPNPEKEIEPALKLLGPIQYKFVQISEIRDPVTDGAADGVFVTASYDPSSHFEDASTEVLALWKKITGESLDLTCIGKERGSSEDQSLTIFGSCSSDHGHTTKHIADGRLVPCRYSPSNTAQGCASHSRKRALQIPGSCSSHHCYTAKYNSNGDLVQRSSDPSHPGQRALQTQGSCSSDHGHTTKHIANSYLVPCRCSPSNTARGCASHSRKRALQIPGTRGSNPFDSSKQSCGLVQCRYSSSTAKGFVHTKIKPASWANSSRV